MFHFVITNRNSRVEREEHHAHGHAAGRSFAAGRQSQQQVDQPGLEREPEMDVEQVGDRQRQSGEQRVTMYASGNATNMKANSSGSGDTGEKAVRPAADRMPSATFFCRALATWDHRQPRRAGRTSDRVEAAGEPPGGQVAGLTGRPPVTTPPPSGLVKLPQMNQTYGVQNG